MSESKDEKKSAAGKKRWENVKPSERKAAVTAAAHARWKNKDVVIAEASSVLDLAGMHLPCAVLKDGRRVLSERGLSDALGYQRTGTDYDKRRETKAAGGEALPVFVADPRISQFLPQEALEKLKNPIRYQRTKGFGIPAWAIDATILADICFAYLDAQKAGVLTHEEQEKVEAANALTRALAKVGIVALIDEATGYQVKRGRDELQKLLDQYVSAEYRPWTKMFPDEFYIELFRLRKLKMDDVRKRPAYFGHLTNDLVYSRMVPGMLPRLNEVNPAEDGKRRRTNVQHMEKQGREHLQKHLSGLVMLMRAHESYTEFYKALNRAAPKQIQTPSSPDVEE